MEIRDMQMSDIEVRAGEIAELLKAEDADIEALTAETEELEARKAEILKAAEERKALLDEVEATAVEVETIEKEGEGTMEIKELRNTPEYIDAYAEMIKGDDRELRALLTENATNGTVAVPEFVEERIRGDWSKKPILAGIRKVFVKGNYKVNYEASASDAVKHTEGANAPAQETLTLAIINYLPEYYKKWIKVSDSVLALRGEAFLNYLLSEFENKIYQVIEDDIVAELEASTLTAKVTHALDKTAVLNGIAALSDEAANPVAIMSKTTWAAIKEDALDGNVYADPFEGLQVLFNSTATGVLVGDLDCIVGNFPEGFEIKFVVDEKTYAEEDMIKVVGKLMGDVHLVQPAGFALVKNA